MTTPDAVAAGDPEGLKERAERYRKMAMEITDRMAIEALLELAERYETVAAELEAPTPSE